MARKSATAKPPVTALVAVKRLDGVSRRDGGAIKLELLLDSEAAKALVDQILYAIVHDERAKPQGPFANGGPLCKCKEMQEGDNRDATGGDRR